MSENVKECAFGNLATPEHFDRVTNAFLYSTCSSTRQVHN